MAVFEQNYRVCISNVGKNGLIKNVGMLSILEDVACRHSDKAGFGIMDIPTKHLSWILLNWKVKILRRVSYGENLKVRTWAKNYNKFQTIRDFEVFDDKGNLVCIATSKWALIDVAKSSIARITDEIIKNYEPDEKNVFENPEIDKLVVPSSFSSEFTYKVQRKDIDVNNHMHNLNYLDVAYEALPEDIYNSTEYNNIEIMYKKGIMANAIVKCLYSFENNAHFVTIKSEDEKIVHAIIKLY